MTASPVKSTGPRFWDTFTNVTWKRLGSTLAHFFSPKNLKFKDADDRIANNFLKTFNDDAKLLDQPSIKKNAPPVGNRSAIIIAQITEAEKRAIVARITKLEPDTAKQLSKLLTRIAHKFNETHRPFFDLKDAVQARVDSAMPIYLADQNLTALTDSDLPSVEKLPSPKKKQINTALRNLKQSQINDNGDKLEQLLRLSQQIYEFNTQYKSPNEIKNATELATYVKKILALTEILESNNEVLQPYMTKEKSQKQQNSINDIKKSLGGIWNDIENVVELPVEILQELHKKFANFR